MGLPLPCLTWQKTEERSHHQHSFGFGIKMFAPGGVVFAPPKAAVRALTEGPAEELHSQHPLHVISPGALPPIVGEQFGRSDQKEFARVHENGSPASTIARAIAYAIEQPVDVEVDEMVIRPTVQDF